jgi:hypothetical protein
MRPPRWAAAITALVELAEHAHALMQGRMGIPSRLGSCTVITPLGAVDPTQQSVPDSIVIAEN